MAISTAQNKGFWLAESGSPSLSQGRSYSDRGSATVADLLVTILGIGPKKADDVISRIVCQSTLLDDSVAWQRLRETTPLELQAAGLTKAQATKTLAAIELGRRAYMEKPGKEMVCIDDPAIAAELLTGDLMWQKLERFAVIALDVKNRVIGHEVLSQGTKTECLVCPREIFGWLLRVGACRTIVAHNHPSGSLQPSDEDIALTKQLLGCGKNLNLSLLDHLILGNGTYTSLRQTTNLWTEYS